MKLNHPFLKVLAALFYLFSAANPLLAGPMKTLAGHVPVASKALAAKGDLPPANEMKLALGLPLRDAAGLETFLQEVADPRSPKFRQYLTPEEFTARFGPTENDYAALKNFARANGLRITAEHANRLVLDVSGSAANVQRALSVKLQRFNHPTERREFFAPDREPSVDAAVPLADVSGLNNFKLPHPKSVKPKTISARARPHGGSAPDGSGEFFSSDFRRAYAPDTTLTGAGQMVGLLQFDGFYQRDITAYQDAAGLPHIPVESVLLDGYWTSRWRWRWRREFQKSSVFPPDQTVFRMTF
jgi:subtilase family serine protease